MVRLVALLVRRRMVAVVAVLLVPLEGRLVRLRLLVVRAGVARLHGRSVGLVACPHVRVASLHRGAEPAAGPAEQTKRPKRCSSQGRSPGAERRNSSRFGGGCFKGEAQTQAGGRL